MKRFIIATAIAISVFVSCSERNEGNPVLEEKHITIKAFGENAVTRTTRDSDGKILWSPNEAISLFYHTGTDGGSKFISVNEAKAAQTDFSGVISVMSGVVEGGVVNPRYFYGIYPYNTENSVDADGKIVTVVRDNQDGVPNTFADGHYVSIGKSQGLEMGFYNLCGGFKFRLTRDDVTKVTLKGNNGEILGGKVKVVVGDDNVPLVDEIIDGKTELVMTCPEGSVFQTGADYFFVILPQTLSKGLTFTMETAGGLVGERVVEVSVDIPRSYFSYSDSPVDTGVEYGLSGNIVFADPAVKAICVANWDTDDDGELSYVEAASVTTIPYGVFSDKADINSFDEFQYFTGVTSLGYTSFYTTPNSYGGRNVYMGAFSNSGLVSIKWPINLDYIPKGAFYGCKRLSSISFVNGCTSIMENAFSGCTGLTSLIIPEGVTDIGSYAFEGCSSITSISIPSSLLSLPIGFIKDCISLKEIVVPEGVTTIGYEAFGGCVDISVTLPTTIESMRTDSPTGSSGGYGGAFYGSLLNTLTVPVPVLPNDRWLDGGRYGAHGVSYISSKKLVIINPDSKEYSVLPYDLHYFGFEEIVFAAGLTEIGGDGLSGWNISDKLRSVEIPNGCTKLADYCFSRNLLTNVVIPETVISIGNGSFRYCNTMESITVNAETPAELGSDAFPTNDCPIYVPSGSVGAYKSAPGWSNYADRIFAIEEPSVSFSDQTVQSICVANWDTNQDGELSVTEMAAVTTLGDVFKNNTSITSFDEFRYFTGLTSLYDSFSKCTNLTSITLPESVKTISGAFYQCSSLVTVNLPSGLQTIGSYSFVSCTSLKSVTIPASVTSIGSNAFASCTGLEQIVLLPTTPPTFSESCFYNVNCPIYVPKGTLDAYKEAGMGKIPIGLLVEMTQ